MTFTSGRPDLAMMKASPRAASSTSRERWGFASWMPPCFMNFVDRPYLIERPPCRELRLMPRFVPIGRALALVLSKDHLVRVIPSVDFTGKLLGSCRAGCPPEQPLTQPVGPSEVSVQPGAPGPLLRARGQRPDVAPDEYPECDSDDGGRCAYVAGNVLKARSIDCRGLYHLNFPTFRASQTDIPTLLSPELSRTPRRKIKVACNFCQDMKRLYSRGDFSR